MTNLKPIFAFIILRVFVAFSQGFEFGSGTASDPFVITTPQHLNNLRLYTGPTHSDKHFVLQNDINLGVSPWNEGNGWEPIGTYVNDSTYTAFEGKLDGNNKRVLNLFINRDSVPTGLFGYCKGEIRNLGMDSVNIQGLTSYAGGLCGALDSGLIEGCFSSGSVSGVSFVGGLVGWLRKSSRAVNCYSSAVVNGSQWVGGLIGSNDRSFVIGCHSSYEVHGTYRYIGGLLGNIYYGSVSKSYTTSRVLGNTRSGGFVGECVYAMIDSCSSAGDVIFTGNENGGFVGFHSNSGVIRSCTSSCRVQGKDVTGGFVGYNLAEIHYSLATGSVEGLNRTGGFAGNNDWILRFCGATGEVHGGEMTGGLAGDQGWSIQYCFAYGNVFGTKEIGGLAGCTGGRIITNSFSVGNVQGDNNVGGIAGRLGSDSVVNCYSTGSVTASQDYAGGFSNGNSIFLNMCYSTGKVSCPGSSISGFMYFRPRDINMRVYNSYYDSVTTECADTNGAKPLSTEQMTIKSSFVGWDFDTIWAIDEGTTYPYLRWQSEPGEYNLIPGATNNRKDLVKLSRYEKAIVFRGNEIILPYGNCTVRLFSISGTLISSFTAAKPGAYDFFRGKRLSNGAYLVLISGPGRESLRKVMVKK